MWGTTCKQIDFRLCRQEWEKGQQQLAADLAGHKVGYQAARMNRRPASDIYGRGVVRGSVECANLITNSQHHDPTNAESIKTARTTAINLNYALQLAGAAFQQEPWPMENRRQRQDKRRRKQQLTSIPFWTAYGGRGRNPNTYMLSANEFARHYYFGMAMHPCSLPGYFEHQQQPDKYRAQLTEMGVGKLSRNNFDLVAGQDYQIRDEGGADWHPFGNGEHVQDFRHDWVVARKSRPDVPVIFGAQGNKTMEEQAMMILVLFVPWVNTVGDASNKVPFIGDLRRPHMEDWCRALRFYFFKHGFPTQEVKQFAIKFCEVYCLPRNLQPEAELLENSDDEGIEDEELHLDEEDLLEARRYNCLCEPLINFHV